MEETNWKRLWSGRTAEKSILHSGNMGKIFMELKRANGFDVVKGGSSWSSTGR